MAEKNVGPISQRIKFSIKLILYQFVCVTYELDKTSLLNTEGKECFKFPSVGTGLVETSKYDLKDIIFRSNSGGFGYKSVKLG